ncbi:DUF7281 domain-containing protein [Tateyamaria pelophila]|uniref:DUF7281 domain-containing protein n=1 Tax=Tateyamaria pelophila TaxID=328415 RepID=UPI001CBC9168|nr:hypothetical protein [Tateyamaria pelophila]
MSRSLIKSALRALAATGSYAASSELLAYIEENNISVTRSGKSIVLGSLSREKLKRCMERDHKVPPGTTEDALEGLTRTEALSFSTNEKVSREAVRSLRVAVKALHESPVMMGKSEHVLPPGINLDVGIDAASLFARHACAVQVENWEAFERIHALNFPIPEQLTSALVVYRGQPGGYPIGAARRFLEALEKPIYVFPDLDPAGLRIALETPGFAGLLLPPIPEIEAMFAEGRGLSERYLSQLSGSERILDATVHPDVRQTWNVLKRFGQGIPQEWLVQSPFVR